MNDGMQLPALSAARVDPVRVLEVGRAGSGSAAVVLHLGKREEKSASKSAFDM